MPHKSKTTQALQHMHNSLKALGFNKEGQTHDSFQYDLDYELRVFDTIARMLQIAKPCCAVYPELSPLKDGRSNIDTLHVSFNTSLNAAKQEQLQNVFEIVLQAMDDSLPPEDRLNALVQTVMLNSNYYHNGRAPKWFEMTLLGAKISEHMLIMQKIYAVEFPALQKQLHSIGELEQQVIQMREQNIPADDLELELYYDYMELCAKFFEDGTVHEYLENDITSADRDSLYNTLYYPYRLYADCKKLVELMPALYTMEEEVDGLEIVDNPDNAHAELVLLQQFNLSPQHHIGISKLCCAQCHAIFGHFQKQGYFKEDLDVVLGSHGFANLTQFKTGALADSLSPEEQIEFMCMLMKAVPQNNQAPGFVEQNSYLSDDEDVIDTQEDPRFVSVKHLYALLKGGYATDKYSDTTVVDKFETPPDHDDYIENALDAATAGIFAMHELSDEEDNLLAIGTIAQHVDARRVLPPALNIMADASEEPPVMSPPAPTTVVALAGQAEVALME